MKASSSDHGNTMAKGLAMVKEVTGTPKDCGKPMEKLSARWNQRAIAFFPALRGEGDRSPLEAAWVLTSISISKPSKTESAGLTYASAAAGACSIHHFSSMIPDQVVLDYRTCPEGP